MGWWARRQCRHNGHDWWPEVCSEFIPTTDVCLRPGCDEIRVHLPTADCLGGHPLTEHYTEWGHPKGHPTCPGPR